MTLRLERTDRQRQDGSSAPRIMGVERLARPAPRDCPSQDRPWVAVEVALSTNRTWERFRPRPIRRRGPGLPSALAEKDVRPVAVGRVRCSGARPAAVGYRLSRWARLSITLSVVTVGLLLASGALPLGMSSGSSTTVTVTVHPGDTLWSIVGQVAPNSNTGDVVQRVRELNHLDDLGPGAALPVGLDLLVPVTVVSP